MAKAKEEKWYHEKTDSRRTTNDTIHVFTDGACSGNPGPGGWAMVICLDTGLYVAKGNDIDTTNNKMELTAAVEATKWISENCKQGECYHINTDSSYIFNAITKRWLETWMSRDWTTAKGDRVKNKPMWQKLLKYRAKAYEKGTKIIFRKVAGHKGVQMNEFVDRLAVEESKKAARKLGL